MRRSVKLFLALFLVCASGCTGISVSRGGTRGLLPEIPAPDRPVLQELTPEETLEAQKLSPGLKAKIQANQLELMKYTKKFEVSVQTYNAYAETNNALARQELGLETKATKAQESKKPEFKGPADADHP